MKFFSVCSGIEAASLAWEPLGWEPWAFSEIEKFPSAVLAHRWPDVPNLGDMTKFKEWPDADVDVLVGGTPCQSFSVAGLRKGLADPRGNLALTFLAILDRYRPRWILWENVPGVLSSDGGRDFGAFLGGLGQLGYGWGYRVLDAQYFGVPQRRRRIFVVGYLGDWRPPAAVLFERESLSGNPPPRRETGQGIAHDIAPSIGASGRGFERAGETRGQDPVIAVCAYGGNNTAGPIDVATACNAHGGPHGRMDFESETFVTHALTGEGHDASEDGTGRGTPIVPIIAPCLTQHYGKQPDNSDTASGPMIVAVAVQTDVTPKYSNDLAFTLKQPSPSGGGQPQAVAVSLRGRDGGVAAEASEVPSALRASQGGGDKAFVATDYAVRRLTPRECERLMGLPDNHTMIPWRGKPAEQCPDGPRYRAIGNSMAVPVMRWIGERIKMVAEL